MAGTTTYDDSTTSVTFTPSAALSASSTYNVTLSGSTDLAGNVIAAPVTWSFTTVLADTTKPTVVSTTPASGATDVSATTTVQGGHERAAAAGQLDGHADGPERRGGGFDRL